VDVDLDTIKGTRDLLRKRVVEFIATSEAPRTRAPDFLRPGVKLESKAATDAAKQDRDTDIDRWLSFTEKRPDLQGLPFRKGAACRLDPASDAYRLMAEFSLGIPRILAMASERKSAEHGMPAFRNPLISYILEAGHPNSESNRDPFLLRLLPARKHEVDVDRGVATLVQMLQPESADMRGTLTYCLSAITGRNATVALARLAVFDPSIEIRKAAACALGNRRAEDWRCELLAAFRYPWPAIADHAALALLAAEDPSVVADLVDLLDEPDPSAPYVSEQGKWTVRELVRVNHLRNCFLCHAPSTDERDAVRGLVPTPGQRISRALYYQSREGVFVRADVTYLRQDFSLMHPVKDHGAWPEQQRFDYLVRERELSREEVAKRALVDPVKARKQAIPDRQIYPQREAVLYALRELTGADGGRSAANWRKILAQLPPEFRGGR
jgi:hypothetical protein